MKDLKKPTERERQIAEARNSGLSFCELDDVDRRVALDQIIFRATAIAGCMLPQTDMFATFISDEISKHILGFGFSEYTLDEILLALQFNATGNIKNPSGEDLEQVDFFGACVNVIYLGKILRNYKVLRDNLDRKIQNQLDGY